MKKSTITLIFIIITLILISIDFPVEIRFQSIVLNYLFILFLLIILLLISYKKLSNIKNKFFQFIGFFIHLFLSTFVLYFSVTSTYEVLKNKTDPSFEMIKEISVNNKYFRLYRTNGGATTSYGLILREEKNLPFGLKYVKIIFKKYKAYDTTLKIIPPNQLQIKINPYSNNQKIDKRIYEF